MEFSEPLRSATADDAEAIAALHIASWQVAYRGALPNAFLDNQDVSERTIVWQNRLCHDSEMNVLLYEKSGELLGFCASGPTRDDDQNPDHVWEIYNLHISPSRRGLGLGTTLITTAQQLGQNTRRREMSLWVVVENVLARRFYEKHGMWNDGAYKVHPIFVGAELNETRYRCAL